MTKLDFTTSFQAHPDTGNLLIRSGNSVIQQRVANLIRTEKFERPHQPDIGTNLQSMLFETINVTNSRMIKSLITETIENYERGIDLQAVEVVPDVGRNRYVISLVYRLSGEQQSIQQQLILTRDR